MLTRRLAQFHQSKLNLLLLSSCVAVLLSTCAAAQNRVIDMTCVRVDAVGPAPGFWSGQVVAVQWIEATVTTTSQKDTKVGDHIKFGVYVVHGSEIADKGTPRLSAAIFHPGATISILHSSACKPPASGDSVYDPTCVRRGCVVQVSKPGKRE